MRFVLAALVIGCCANVGAAETRSLAKLFHAIGEVESGNNDNIRAGDNGKSHGRYQIQRGYWKDSGVKGSYQQVKNKAYAERVMIGYWQRHCPNALKSCNYEVLSRVHNGGPAGYRYKSTLKYWKAVRANLRS